MYLSTKPIDNVEFGRKPSRQRMSVTLS